MWTARARAICWAGAATAGVLVPVLIRNRWIPSGIPGEWTWGLLEHPIDLAVLGPALAALPLLALLWYGGWLLAPKQNPALRPLMGLLGTVGAGVAFLALQTSPPTPYNIARWPNILYWPMSSGYFEVAREELGGPDWREFLASYPDFQRAQPDPFHIATHPPGLVLLHASAIWLCRRHPSLTAALLRTEPELLRLGFSVIPPMPPAERASLTLVAYFTFAVTCFGFWPVWIALRKRAPARVAWGVSTLWWFTPGVAVFCPKSDVLYPTLAALILTAVLWLADAAGRGGLRCFVSGAALGLSLWIGMLLSFAFVAVWAIGLVAAALVLARSADRVRFRWLAGWGVALLVFGLLTGGFYGLTSCNLVDSWWACYTRHAEFNVRFPRSYWGWLLADLVEFFLAAGAITACGGMLGVFRSLKSWRRGGTTPRLSVLAYDGLVLSWAAMFFVLLVSGKNRGEVARLWLLFVPFLLLAGARSVDAWRGKGRLILLAAQAISAFLLVNTVQGFVDPHSVKVGDAGGRKVGAVVAASGGCSSVLWVSTLLAPQAGRFAFGPLSERAASGVSRCWSDRARNHVDQTLNSTLFGAFRLRTARGVCYNPLQSMPPLQE